jgi:hypothetical protein
MLYEHRDFTNPAEGFRWLQVVSETESIFSVSFQLTYPINHGRFQ